MAQQIIITKDNYGIELECYLVNAKKKPIDITGYSVELAILNPSGVQIDLVQAIIKSPTTGWCSYILDTKHTSEEGLYTTIWTSTDTDGYITAQENMYYFVKEKSQSSDSSTSISDADGLEEKIKGMEDELSNTKLTVLNELNTTKNLVNNEIDNTKALVEEVKKVNVSAEIVDARGGLPSLGEKVRELNEQLDNIIPRTSITKDRFNCYKNVNTNSKWNPYYIVGDSISEGYNSKDFVNGSYASIVTKALLQECDYQNIGFVNFGNGLGSKKHHVINKQGFNLNTNPDLIDYNVWGGIRLSSETIGDYVEVTFTQKNAKLCYKPLSNGGNLDVYVDDLKFGSVDTTVKNIGENFSWSGLINFNDNMEHKVKFVKTDNKPTDLLGMIYGEELENQCPLIFNVGISGLCATDLSDSLIDEYCSSGMLILALGVNDRHNKRDLTLFYTKLKRFCENIKKINGSMIICDFIFNANESDEYKKVLKRISTEYKDFIFLDFAKLSMGDENLNKFSNFIDTDGVHPKLQGHEFIANTIIKYIGLPYTKSSLKIKDKWHDITLLNNWTTMPNTETPQYFMDENGFVHIGGLVVTGTINIDTEIFKLPTKYIPTKNRYFNVICSNNSGGFEAGCIYIDSASGTMRVGKVINGWLSLEIPPYQV